MRRSSPGFGALFFPFTTSATLTLPDRHIMIHMRCSTAVWSVLAALLAVSCATSPPPIVVYQDAQTSVRLIFDPESGSGHSHPASVTPEQMAMVLRGLRVRGRDVVGGFGLFSDAAGASVFSSRDVVLLAPKLSEALKKASPKDLATFYVVAPDSNLGAVVTSGGLFVRKDRLYFILANARTSPGSVQYENTYTPDLRDQPLLPIARFKFTADFSPNEVRIPHAQAKREDGYERYLDESKMLVLDLSRLFAASGGQPAAPVMPATPASPPSP